jgi:hypothetical protein
LGEHEGGFVKNKKISSQAFQEKKEMQWVMIGIIWSIPLNIFFLEGNNGKE